MNYAQLGRIVAFLEMSHWGVNGQRIKKQVCRLELEIM